MSPLEEPGLILQHEAEAPAGHFGDWADDRGIPYSVHPVWAEELPADPSRYGWICSLGSEHTPGRDSSPAWVDAEVRFLADALAARVPILGICFGGQALAAAAGGTVHPADPPEVGWLDIETSDPGRVPPGPWLQFHYDQLEMPPGARELARSPAGTAAFDLDSSMGLQFHPEVTPEIANGWAESESATLRRIGISADELAEAAEQAGEGARRRARELFTAWWGWLGG